MMATRRLQGEIDRCLKKVGEGVDLFEDLWQKLQNATNPNQKDKYETDLKKEIKKLQRLRDQIKTWIASPDIKDKTVLVDTRKLIETHMERFRTMERETKTKAYSKEGLGAVQKVDPMTKERENLNHWVNTSMNQMQIQMDQMECEMESMLAGNKRKLKKAEQERVSDLQMLMERHRFHVGKLETILRVLDNISVDNNALAKFMSQVKDIKDDISYYLESHQEPEFEENEFIYDSVEGLKEFEDGLSQQLTLAINYVGEEDCSGTPSSPHASPDVSRDSSEEQMKEREYLEDYTEGAPDCNYPMTKVGSGQNAGVDGASSSDEGNYKDDGSDTVAVSYQPDPIWQLRPSELMAPPVHVQEEIGAISSLEGSTAYDYTASHNDLAVSQSCLDSFAGMQINTASSDHHFALSQRRGRGEFGPGVQTGPPGFEDERPDLSNIVKIRITHRVAIPTTSGGQEASRMEQYAGNRNSRGGGRMQGGNYNVDPSGPSGSSMDNPPTQQDPPKQYPMEEAGGGTETGYGSVPPEFHTPEYWNKTLLNRFYPVEAEALAKHLKLVPMTWPDHFGRIGPYPGAGYAPLTEDDFLEADIPPQLGAAPLGRVELTKEEEEQLELLEGAHSKLPIPADSERRRAFLPRNPVATPLYYPQQPIPLSDTLEHYQRLSSEILFFIFYYHEGTKAQHLAATVLKQQSWRFHTKFMMWFQRHEDPKIITEHFEQGSYVYFDIATWGLRKKDEFVFEYRYLESTDLP